MDVTMVAVEMEPDGPAHSYGTFGPHGFDLVSFFCSLTWWEEPGGPGSKVRQVRDQVKEAMCTRSCTDAADGESELNTPEPGEERLSVSILILLLLHVLLPLLHFLLPLPLLLLLLM